MIRRRSELNRLDGAITALENFILSETDYDIVAQSPQGIRAANDVRVLIERHLANRDARSQSDRVDARHAHDRRGHIAKTSRNELDRLAFLRAFVAARPELPTRLSAVFGSGKAPTNEELDHLVDELVRLGMLSKDEPRD